MRPSTLAAVLAVALAAGCVPDAGTGTELNAPASHPTPIDARDLATGETGRGGERRDAGRSGSLSEGVVLGSDDRSGSSSGLACDACENLVCSARIDRCDAEETSEACGCADLCVYGCFETMGGCGYDPEELSGYVDYIEDRLEDSGVDCL